MALRLTGFLSALCQISLTRQGRPEAKFIGKALDLVCNGNLAILGCLADAGAEGMRFIRHFDRENTDAELISKRIQEFKDNLHVLFGSDGIVWDVIRCRGTFMGAVSSALDKPIVLSYWSPDRGNTTRVVGGCEVLTDGPIMASFGMYCQQTAMGPHNG